MTDGAEAELETRVLVLAPTARDALATRDILAAVGVAGVVCPTVADVCREALRGAGAAVLTAEAILADEDGRLRALLCEQPPWSDLPLIVLTPPGVESPKLLQALEAVGAMTLMKRPVQISSIVSTVRVALRDRRRQYAVREHLAERVRAEEVVRERDERLQLFLGNATDYAVIISDTEDRATEWLGGAEKITGWRADEVIGKSLEFIFNPEDQAAGVPAQETLRAAETGRAENTRWHQRKDGSQFFAEGVTVGIRGPAGELRGFGKVFRDATEKKRTEERLTRDAMLLANVHDAVVMTDVHGIVTYWNEGASRLFGWTADEMVGRHYADRFAEPVRSWVADEIRQRAAGSEWSGEYEDYRKDGSRVWIDARVTSIRDATGAVAGVLGVSHDISERRRVEVALRASEERLKRMVNVEGVGVLVWGLPDGRLLSANDFFLRMFGYTREEVESRPLTWRDMTPPEYVAVSEAQLAGFAETGRIGPYEKEYFRKDGTRAWMVFAGASLGDDTVVEYCIDVSDRKRAEATLREADRQKDDFIALLAHELRNPLAPIRNGLQVLRLSPDRAAWERAQQMMDRQLAHMVRLIDDLLDVSRINRNKMELRRSRILLSDPGSTATRWSSAAVASCFPTR
jgi:PAS domain S-box-containing protein